MEKIPFMLLGDGPQEPTGLGRIARDLSGLLSSSDLPIDFVQVGGRVPPVWQPWRHYPLDRRDDWGAGCCEALWDSIFGRRPGILLIVWDPSRLAAYRDLAIPVQRWAYPAVDAEGLAGGITGPAGDALREFDRILAYGRWGSQVVTPQRAERVPYLPHGLTLRGYQESQSEGEQAWVDAEIGPHRAHGRDSLLIGCVAANQARKDLALYFCTLAELRRRGHAVHGWLHTDVLVKPDGLGWSVQQLVSDTGLAKHVTVTLQTYRDRELACLYQACDATIAPGLGEGFGYPIVESLASGTPVIAGNYAGGVELVPKAEWRVPPRAWRYEGVYANLRPIYTAEDCANAVERALGWREAVGRTVAREYCYGAVAHLEWAALWPRWREWIVQGLEGR